MELQPLYARALIRERGWSVPQVARWIDYNPAHLYGVLSGRRPLSRKVRRRLSETLHMHPDLLFPEYADQTLPDRATADA